MFSSSVVLPSCVLYSDDCWVSSMMVVLLSVNDCLTASIACSRSGRGSVLIMTTTDTHSQGIPPLCVVLAGTVRSLPSHYSLIRSALITMQLVQIWKRYFALLHTMQADYCALRNDYCLYKVNILMFHILLQTSPSFWVCSLEFSSVNSSILWSLKKARQSY